MSILKKSIFMNIVALPIVAIIGVSFTSSDAVAGFKWTAPTNKVQFPKEGMKTSPHKPNINWGESSRFTHKNNEMFVEESLPAPVTMETLETIQKGGIATKEDAVVAVVTDEIPDRVSDDVISSVMMEDKQASVASRVSKTAEIAGRTVVEPSNFKVDNAKTIKGFGKEIPLVMAIRQIVPADYPFAFNKGVNLAERVSWNGGKSWDSVLNKTLSSVGLTATQYNKVIMIGLAETTTIMTPAPVVKLTEPDAPIMEQPNEVRSEVVAPAQDMAMTESVTLPLWRGYKGQTLRNVVTVWSKRENIKLYWTVDYDFRLHEDVLFEGSYDIALKKLLDQFSDVDPQPYGTISKDDDGNKILLIKIYDSMT